MTKKRRIQLKGEAKAPPQIPQKFEIERKLPQILPMNERQAEYLEALKRNPQIIVMGPAGTGKTYIAATYAADQLRAKKISKIILTRPNVPAGRSLGFFPGSLEEKIEPWMAQVPGHCGHTEPHGPWGLRNGPQEWEHRDSAL
jgi:phosphate starvation-inducible protein PhoH and related proteins